MSETVHYKGCLQKVSKINDETLEELCKRIIIHTSDYKHEDLEITPYDSWEEYLCSERYDEYVIVDDDVYKVLSREELYEGFIATVKKLDNDKYQYEVEYYNGGCSFSEAINEAFQNEKYENQIGE